MKKTLIIAEAGVNHNGNLNLAKKIIIEAKKAGADVVKFQVFKADELAAANTPKASYQKKSKFKNQYEMLKSLEFSEKDFVYISKFCKKKKIRFSASFFNINSLKIINKLNLHFIKIPSGEITNYFLLKRIGSLKKKIILSTGMSNLNEIDEAVRLLINSGTKKKNITLLHCNTEYPSPLKDINLKALNVLKKKFNLTIGYSDHSISLLTPCIAIALGATVIEKHLTLNKRLKGPDHQASLNPSEFKKMVSFIRDSEKILGKEKKIISRSEKKNIPRCRQYLVAKKEIKKNEILSLNNITSKRIGTYGLSPMLIKNLLNKKARKNYFKDEKL